MSAPTQAELLLEGFRAQDEVLAQLPPDVDRRKRRREMSKAAKKARKALIEGEKS